MSSSLKLVASLTLSFGLYMLYDATSLSSKMVRDIRSSSLMNTVSAIVRFAHLSFNCAHPQLAQCRIFFSAVKGKAVLHFRQERYVVTFSTPSAGQETVLRPEIFILLHLVFCSMTSFTVVNVSKSWSACSGLI